MTFHFSKEIYNKEAVLKAAYSYTDRAYLHIGADKDSYVVDIIPRSNDINIDEQEFQNEVLSQMVREIVQDKTKNVREIILARALSSTVISGPVMKEEEKEGMQMDIKDILSDWFEKYES